MPAARLITYTLPYASRATVVGPSRSVRLVGVGLNVRWAPTMAGLSPVAILMSVPRKVMASSPESSDTTSAPEAMESTPALALCSSHQG